MAVVVVTSIGAVEAREKWGSHLAALPADRDGLLAAFDLGFEAACREIERCAAHWERFPLNDTGKVATRAMREATSAVRRGWDELPCGGPR